MELDGVLDNVVGFVKENAVAVGVGAGVVSAGIIGTTLALSGSSTKKKARRSTTKKGRSRDRKFKSKQKWEQKYKRKRKFKVYKSKKSSKSKHKKGIHYTKKGQPYRLLSNGKARFIKKK
jgi:hypothetical protein